MNYYRPDKKIKELHQELRDLEKSKDAASKSEPRPNHSVFWGLAVNLNRGADNSKPNSVGCHPAIGGGSLFNRSRFPSTLSRLSSTFTDVKTRAHGLRRLIPGFIFCSLASGS